MKTIHLAGEAVEARQEFELLFLLMALVDHPDDALRPHRLAVAVGEPASGVLDPELLVGARGDQRILNLIGNAGALVAMRRLHHRINAGERGGRIEQLGVGAAVGDCGRVTDHQHAGGVRAPGQRIALDRPRIRDLADRGHDLRRIERPGRGGLHRLGCEHPRLGCEHRRRRALGAAAAVLAGSKNGGAVSAHGRIFLGKLRCPK